MVQWGQKYKKSAVRGGQMGCGEGEEGGWGRPTYGGIVGPGLLWPNELNQEHLLPSTKKNAVRGEKVVGKGGEGAWEEREGPGPLWPNGAKEYL